MHASVLRYIDQVARLGSIRRAASVLNVASSAVNRQILNLEAEMGVQLFERIGNGVRPTIAGDIVVQHARDTLARWKSARTEIATLGGEIHGEVRIATIAAALVSILPPAIEETVRHHPNISFDISDAAPSEFRRDMRARWPDLAIMFLNHKQAGYEVLVSVKMHLGIVVRPDHPLANKKQVSLAECADYPIGMLKDRWVVTAAAASDFFKSGANLKATIQSNSLPMTRQLIDSGLVIGFFSPAGFVNELRDGTLVHIPLEQTTIEDSQLAVLVRKDRVGDPAVGEVSKSLVERMQVLERELAALA